MYRTALRSASRPALANARTQVTRCVPRRPISTASPADKRRSWKSSAVRWGLAAGAVYYYSTSSVFAEETTQRGFTTPPSSFAESDATLPTVDSVLDEKRKQAEAEAAAQKKKSDKDSEQKKPTVEQPQSTAAQNQSNDGSAATSGAPSSPGDLEEEADQQGAFNPETGEINWDCPCLGGMAHGPCGEEFKTAFSCFVYSTEEPKGMDCIEKFQGMQECFRKYPEIYGAELEGDESDENGAPVMGDGDAQADSSGPAIVPYEPTNTPAATDASKAPEAEYKPESKAADAELKPKAEVSAAPSPSDAETKSETKSESTGPKWEDATAANAEVAAQDKGKEQAKKN